MNNELYMKLVHYFITDKNYETVQIKGLKNEIWLQNFKEHFKIVRIVADEIKSKEEVEKDLEKLRTLGKKIKKTTLTGKLPVLTIYLRSGNVENMNQKGFSFISLDDSLNNDKLLDLYPDIMEKTTFNETGIKLLNKINYDINEHNKKVAETYNKTFRKDLPYLTFILIGLNLIIYFFTLAFPSEVVAKYSVSNLSVFKHKEYLRMITYAFVHSPTDPFHLIFNMLSLYWIGPMIEKYFGKIKFLFIYFGSAIGGALLSIAFNKNSLSVGASGAIFGLLGAIIYFAYAYKDKLSAALLKQMTFIVAFNLFYGFLQKGIDNWGHIGGLIMGFTWGMCLGTYKKRKALDYIVSTVFLVILYIFFTYLGLQLAA